MSAKSQKKMRTPASDTDALVRHKETTNMKLKNVLNATKVVLFAAVMLAACLSASAAKAQSALNGKFTLTENAYWGHGVLPAGEYELSIATTGLPSMVVVRDATTGKEVAKLFPQVRELSIKGESELLIGTRGKRSVIYSLRVPALGMVFIWDPNLAREAEQEARNARVVPVIVAAK
jgi:hypothetical protein